MGIRFTAIFTILLTMGIGQAWADKGFFGEGQWNIQYWDGSGDKWGNSYNNASTYDLGIKTTLYFKEGWVKTWSNGGWTQSYVIWYWGWSNGSTTNNWRANKSNVQGDQTWNFNIDDYDLIANAPNNPGYNTLYMHWRLDDYISSGNSMIKFTIPGFTTTSTNQSFDNTIVSSNSSKNISFGQHYGTALNANNCVISGTNKSEFSVTSITETDVTVKFAPTSAGDKSATLTITDAHGKVCTVTLSGKTQYVVTYSKGNYGTGNNKTAYKVYGTNLTLADKGNFTRENYTQTAWNTNADGTSGTSYALKANYSREAAITLYPTWTGNPQTVTWKVNGENYTTGSPTTSVAYNSKVTTLPTAPSIDCNGKVFVGWSNQEVTDGQKPSVLFTSESNAPAVTGATTYHAVFATEAAEAIDPIIFADQGWGNGTELSTHNFFDGLINFSFEKNNGSDAPKYYDTGSSIRLYYNNKMTITSTSDEIQTITFHFVNKDAKGNSITADTGEKMDKTPTNASIESLTHTWTVNSNSVVFTIGSYFDNSGTEQLKGHCKISRIDITTTGLTNFRTSCSYTATWQVNGGQWSDGTTEDIVQEYNMGATITPPTNPKRTGYTFAGWDPAVPATMPAEDLTFTAIWENCRWVETDIDNIQPDDEVVVAMETPLGTYTLDHSKGTGTYPPALPIEANGNEVDVSSAYYKNCIWNISGNVNDGFVLYPNGQTET